MGTPHPDPLPKERGLNGTPSACSVYLRRSLRSVGCGGTVGRPATAFRNAFGVLVVWGKG